MWPAIRAFAGLRGVVADGDGVAGGGGLEVDALGEIDVDLAGPVRGPEAHYGAIDHRAGRSPARSIPGGRRSRGRWWSPRCSRALSSARADPRDHEQDAGRGEQQREVVPQAEIHVARIPEAAAGHTQERPRPRRTPGVRHERTHSPCPPPPRSRAPLNGALAARVPPPAARPAPSRPARPRPRRRCRLLRLPHLLRLGRRPRRRRGPSRACAGSSARVHYSCRSR